METTRNISNLTATNDLEKIFLLNTDRPIHKWWHYFEIYHQYFEKFRNKPITILEIGVQHGGSIRMWKEYFGKDAKVVGIDIDSQCKELEEPGIDVRIGSQDDPIFLQSIIDEYDKFDIIIDDGGHYMNQQIISLDILYPFVSDNGIYLCEDIQTSYWPQYDGGLNKPGTFIEYCKSLIDNINYQYWSTIEVNNYSLYTWSIHFYDGIVVFEKRQRTPSLCILTGGEANPNIHIRN